MSPDLKHLIRSTRDNEPLMQRILAALGMTAIVMLSISLLRLEADAAIQQAAPQAPSPSSARPSDAPAVAALSERDLVRFALICMNHGNARLEWDEPHTNDRRASFCSTYSFPMAK